MNYRKTHNRQYRTADYYYYNNKKIYTDYIVECDVEHFYMPRIKREGININGIWYTVKNIVEINYTHAKFILDLKIPKLNEHKPSDILVRV